MSGAIEGRLEPFHFSRDWGARRLCGVRGQGDVTANIDGVTCPACIAAFDEAERSARAFEANPDPNEQAKARSIRRVIGGAPGSR